MKRHPAKWTPRKGDEVRIRFRDHAHDKGEKVEPLDFMVWGRIGRVTRLDYVIDHWAYSDRSEVDRENVANSQILRADIIEIRKILE